MNINLDSLSINSTKKNLLIIQLVSIVLALALVIFVISVSKKISIWEEQWQTYSNKSTTAIITLNQIKSNFGYGGFIHNFKNYILRKDPTLTLKINENIQQTFLAIKKYRLTSPTNKELQSLEIINRTVGRYQEKFILAQQLIAEGVSSFEVDNQVKIDDTDALNALDFLYQLTLSNNQAYKKSTDQVFEEIILNVLLGLIFFPILFITNWLFRKFMRQIMMTAEDLEQASHYLRDVFAALPDSILIINENGKILQSNQEAIKLFRYSEKELVQINIEQLIPEDSRAGHQQLMKAAFTSQNKISSRSSPKIKALTKNGDMIPVAISINFSLLNQEQVAIVSLQDISASRKTQKTLENNQKMLSIAQSLAHIGSWDWDLKADKILWSEEMYSIFNFSSEEFGGSYDAFVMHLHPDDREEVVTAINACIVMDIPIDMEHRIILSDNSEKVVHLRGEVYQEGDVKKHLVGTLHDITLVKQTENELRLSDNVFIHTEEGIFITDSNNCLIKVNPAFSKITGYSSEEAMGKKPEELFKSGIHDQDFYKALWASLLTGGTWIGEIWNRKKDGTEFPCQQNITAIKDENDNIFQYLSVISDVTEKKIAEEHIQNLAQYDQLTKLANRNLFNDRLQQAIVRADRSNKTFALMMIDLDRFKSVNDSLGHQAGDLLLQQVAEKLLECVRKQDTVARLGGDEFIIILEELSSVESSGIIATKILQHLAEKFDLGKQSVNIGGSIGISIFPDDAATSEDLVKYADIAMYQSKNMGKNQYHFYTEKMSNNADTLFFIENRLNIAIENNEFELYYQPQVNTKTKEIYGAEALIRWQDPERGLIQPDQFLPLAEELGLINKIGEWVIRTACTQAKTWQDAGLQPIVVSVNISGQQIIHGDIVELVKKSLKETQLLPQYLELELLENLVMQQPDKVIETIKELKGLGVSLAIDDFGTGYSSLSYLKRLSINRLKIDRSFVIDIPTDTDDRAIVSTIISMAKNLGLSVIAEGTENIDQINFLNKNGCHEMQGYFYSKPVSAQDFSAMLEKNELLN